MILLLPLTFVKTNLNTFKSGVISKDGKPLMGLQLPDSWFLEPAVIPIDVRGDSLAMAWTPDGQILAAVTRSGVFPLEVSNGQKPTVTAPVALRRGQVSDVSELPPQAGGRRLWSLPRFSRLSSTRWFTETKLACEDRSGQLP
jgi:hypothetical protein